MKELNPDAKKGDVETLDDEDGWDRAPSPLPESIDALEKSAMAHDLAILHQSLRKRGEEGDSNEVLNFHKAVTEVGPHKRIAHRCLGKWASTGIHPASSFGKGGGV